MFESECESHSVVSDFLQLHGLYSPWNSSGQNTGGGSLFLLQGIFPTQGSSLDLPHCRRILCLLSHKGSPLFTMFTSKVNYIYLYKKLPSCLPKCLSFITLASNDFLVFCILASNWFYQFLFLFFVFFSYY